MINRYEYWDAFNINNKKITNKYIYKIVNNKIYIFYSIEYKFPKSTADLENIITRDAIRLSLKITGFDFIPKTLQQKNEINNCVCEFCHIARNHTLNIYVSQPQIIICKKCYDNTNPKNYKTPNAKYDYYIRNDIENRRERNIHVDYIKSANGKLIHFYSIFTSNEYFDFEKLLTQLWFSIPNGDNCQWCNNGRKYLLGSCIECYNFILSKFYYTMWIKWDYFKWICMRDEIYKDIECTIFNYFTKLLGFNMFNVKKDLNDKIIEYIPKKIEYVKEEITENDLYDFYERLNEEEYDECELINYDNY